MQLALPAFIMIALIVLLVSLLYRESARTRLRAKKRQQFHDRVSSLLRLKGQSVAHQEEALYSGQTLSIDLKKTDPVGRGPTIGLCVDD